MNKKTCLITGASTGIGYSTALGIAKEGLNVIIASNNRERGYEAAGKIASESNSENVEYIHVNLASFQSIRNFANEFNAKYNRLNILINNAGVYYSKQTFSPDDIEMTIGINHFAPFLLSGLLMDCLQNSGEGRIVNVSSRFHFQGKMHFDNLFLNNKYNGLRAYCQSKLALILYTYKLAELLEGSCVTANCLHPGTIRTNIGNTNASGLYPVVCNIVKPFLPLPEKGAQTSIYLAVSDDVKHINGQYFQNCKSIRSSKRSYSKEQAQRLWQVSEELTGMEYKKYT